MRESRCRLDGVQAEPGDVGKRHEMNRDTLETGELTRRRSVPRLLSLRRRGEQPEVAPDGAERWLEQRRADLPNTQKSSEYPDGLLEFP